MVSALARLPAWITIAIAAEEVFRYLFRQVFRKDARGTQYGGLESLVSFSACLIAAGRAAETELPDAYISDPLAAGLCGPEALAARRGANGEASSASAPAGEPSAGSQQQQHHHQHQELRPIPRLIMRTKFFDDVVTLVTWGGGGAGAVAAVHGCYAQLLAACSGATACTQVVLLGSGLDSRPWRLELPPGVAWFEVDRRDVLAAKQVRLRALGAQFEDRPSQPTRLPIELSPPPQPRQEEKEGGDEARRREECGGGVGGGRAACYPLRAASWSSCAVDLRAGGWSRGLVERGLDVGRPVLWVLEGLLYYLEETDVRALLREAASVSAPGSILAASVIRILPERPAPADHPAPPANASRLGAGAAASGGAAACANGAAAAAGAGTAVGASGLNNLGLAAGASAAAAAGSPNAGSGTPRSGLAGGRPKYNLNSEFKWKCSGSIPQFFKACGWGALMSLSWVDVAKSYGLPTAETSSNVYFVTASVGDDPVSAE